MNSIKRISLTAASKLCLNESKIYDEEERIVGKVMKFDRKGKCILKFLINIRYKIIQLNHLISQLMPRNI